MQALVCWNCSWLYCKPIHNEVFFAGGLFLLWGTSNSTAAHSCTRCLIELWIPDCPFLRCCSWIVEQFITTLQTYLLQCNYCFRLTSMFLYASQREQSCPWLCKSFKCITRWLITKWVHLRLYYPQMFLGVPSTVVSPKNLARFW